VTGFNAFQCAADFVAALIEAGRVTWRGGRVAICSWGRIEDRGVRAIFAPLRDVEPPAATGCLAVRPAPDRRAGGSNDIPPVATTRIEPRSTFVRRRCRPGTMPRGRSPR
jgi:hypothetical protein